MAKKSNLPKGIFIRENKHSSSLIMYFSYKGAQCKETLKLAPTKQNIKYAANQRAEILNQIAKGTFRYSDYFPESKRAKLFGENMSTVTVEELLDGFMKQIQKTKQPSTIKGYNSAVDHHIKPTFGAIRARDLTAALIRDWISNFDGKAKTIRNILTPLRKVMGQALNDDVISVDPFSRINMDDLLDIDSASSDYEIDPLAQNEITVLLKVCEGQTRNLFQFAIYTGLRTSELIGLEWGDIDWHRKIVKVSRAIVLKGEKSTKTRAGIREVDLFPPALDALQNQKAFTYLHSDRIFHNPKTGRKLETDKQIRDSLWKPALKKAGLRYRNPYQCRHTYASMMVSEGENIWWLAGQMGHKTIEMILRHYGKWLPDNNKANGYQSVINWEQKMKELAVNVQT